MKNSIITIDLQAKEWFDKVNGNSYFSAQITLNYGLNGEETIYLPFQYGYGDFYQFEALKALQKLGFISPEFTSLWSYKMKNPIVINMSKREKCLQRDVKAFGKQ